MVERKRPLPHRTRTGKSGGKDARLRGGFGLLGLGLLLGWMAVGGDVVAALNPTLAKLHIIKPALDAWIMPPDYTGMKPIMIATPAGLRHGGQTIEIPDGSTLSIHLAEQDGAVPELLVNGSMIEFTADDHGDFHIRQAIHNDAAIMVRRDDAIMASWQVRVVMDQPPHITLADIPAVTERQSMKFSYQVKDDFGAVQVFARVAPHINPPAVALMALELPLSVVSASEDSVTRSAFQDLTANPWSGSAVDVQLVAVDSRGHRTTTPLQKVTLPERMFTHPVARALVEERKKLYQDPISTTVRNEVANLMAGVAQKPVIYQGDPVVMMALRSGAVRLVLDRQGGGGENILGSVGDLLWQSALRIEYGKAGQVEEDVRQAQQDLSRALDRHADDQEVSGLVDNLYQVLTDYWAALQPAARVGMVRDWAGALGVRTMAHIPDALEKRVEAMRRALDVPAMRREFEQFQTVFENTPATFMNAMDDFMALAVTPLQNSFGGIYLGKRAISATLPEPPTEPLHK